MSLLSYLLFSTTSTTAFQLTTNHISDNRYISSSTYYTTSIPPSTSTTTTTTLYSSFEEFDMNNNNNNFQPEQQMQQPEPQTFREAELLGLGYMQEGQVQLALQVFQKGLKLPGSRTDIVRTKLVSGPSPVGGSSGGTEGKTVMTLDEFELQAAYYNIACAYARLEQISESVANLEKAFKVGFDNYTTVRADPDLTLIQDSLEFQVLMETYDPKKGFPNPFSFFGKK